MTKQITEDTEFQLWDQMQADIKRLNQALVVDPVHLIGNQANDPVAVPFQNGWVNYGSPFCSAGFWMDPFGMVHLQGMVKSGSVGASNPIFTLPSSYTPTYEPVLAGGSNGAYSRVDVLTTGAVVVEAGSNVWVSLDGLQFRIR